ncbi:MAG: Reeler domain-containing protein, partial [Myxococcales bacterium]|nr:Reeler domain-containing protein [Myxococcales bacterium]
MTRIVLAAVMTLSTASFAFSSGAGDCAYPGGSMVGGTRLGTGGFVITSPSTTYSPGQPLQVTISHPQNLLFKGHLIQAVQGQPGTANTNVIGSFSALPAGSRVPSCANGSTHVSQSNTVAKQTVTLTWTPPANATGPITFHAVVVVSFGEWYGQQTLITLTLQRAEVDGGTAGGSAGGGSAGGGSAAGGSAAGGSAAGGSAAGGSAAGGSAAGGSAAGGSAAGGS